MLLGYDRGGEIGAGAPLHLPDDVVASEFLTMEDAQMSASRGVGVNLRDVLERYDPDPVRYYLTAAGPETQDSAFTWGEFVRRNNEELLANWGNLVNRTLTNAYRNFGEVPAAGELGDADRAVLDGVAAVFDTVGELIALLKRDPGKYNFGSIGNGSLSHLAMEAIALKSETKMTHIPYPSSPQAVTALMRGDVQIACLPAIAVTPQLGSGQIKILAITTAERDPLLPGIPTLKEQGIDVEADAWMGLVAPAKTPEPLIAQIGKAFAAAITSPAIREKLATQLMSPVPTTPAQFRARVDADLARWTPVVKAADVRIN
jgi:hypothetical protein